MKSLRPDKASLPIGRRLYINESLCPYYRSTCGKFKNLLGSKFIFSFNILNDNGNENGFTCKNVSVTHDDDLTPFSSKFLPNLNRASAF